MPKQGTTTFPDRKKYSLMQFALAMGGGFKISVNPSFNIICYNIIVIYFIFENTINNFYY